MGATENNKLLKTEIDASPSTSPEVDSSGDTSAGSRQRSVWILAVSFLLLTVALNWPYQHVFTAIRSLGEIDSVIDFHSVEPQAPVVAGWPYRYFIRHPSAPTPTERFSWLALGYNIGLAVLASGILLWYVHRRSKRSVLIASKLTIADLLLLTALLAAPFGWWQHLGVRQSRELAFGKSIQQLGGACRLSASVPNFLEKRLPVKLRGRLLRVRGIRLEHPKQEIVQRMIEFPELNLLRLGGGDYDVKILQHLAAGSSLEDLRVAGRQLDTDMFQAIGQLVRIHTLNLMRTNVTAESITGLDTMPGLQRLNLIHTDVVTADLQSPAWMSTIEELRLPHPDSGDQASLRIAGWPKLETLRINELESQMNSTPMKIELENLPSLKTLELDLFQKFDLILRDLTALKTIGVLEFEWSNRISRGGKIPRKCWVGRVELDGLPAMEKMEFFVAGLTDYRSVNTPKLQSLKLSIQTRNIRNQPITTPWSPEAATALIEGLGHSEGPKRVDMEGVSLTKVDLSPLCGNQRLTELNLSYSGTRLDQWKQLKPMNWLTKLSIRGNPGSVGAISWLLKNFPDLEDLVISDDIAYVGQRHTLHPMKRLEVVDQPKLKTLQMGRKDMSFCSEIRIVNSPKLSLAIETEFLVRLELANSGSLTGLSVARFFPSSAKLQGLRDLKFFAVGGPAITDEVVNAIANCRELRTLTLAYPSITEIGLKRVQHFGSLTSLSLPGTPLTDRIVAQWPKFRTLNHLDLRDTKITTKSVAKLAGSRILERLVLDRTEVKSTELAFLANLPYLKYLSLSGVGIDAKSLAAIFSGTSLSELDLSDSEVSPEVMDLIAAKGQSLEFLMLRNNELDQKRLMAIARGIPGIHFDLAGSKISTRVMTDLLTSHQISSVEEWEMKKRMKEMTQRAANQFVLYEPTYPGMINVRSFADQGQAGSTTPSPMIPPAPSPNSAIPQRSLGNRLGNWLGNALLRVDPSGVDDDDPTDGKDEDDVQEASSPPTGPGKPETKPDQIQNGVDSIKATTKQVSP